MKKFNEALKAVNEACQKILGEKAHDEALKTINTVGNLHGPARAEQVALAILARENPRRSL